MKRLLLAALLLPLFAHSQNQDLTYSKVLTFDTLTKGAIYDNALAWCAKSFGDSKEAISMANKESSIINGQAYYDSYYYMPGKKDSAIGITFTKYHFKWTIETKDGKLRFQIYNVRVEVLGDEYPVTTEGEPPIKIMFKSKEKTQMEWDYARKYLIDNLDKIPASLYSFIENRKDSW